MGLRNEKERKEIKRNDFAESFGIITGNDRKNDRKRPKTTGNDRKRPQDLPSVLPLRGMDSSEIPRFSPYFPRFSVHIPQKNTPGAESTEGINFCCFYIFI